MMAQRAPRHAGWAPARTGSLPAMEPGFTWKDGERQIRFGRGSAAASADLLGAGYTLLSTERALQAAPGLAEGAAAVHHVPPGRVDEIAAALLPVVEGDLLVALGGGRVIDTAKALAAVTADRRVAAVPTTLSAAEMTWLHRHAAGATPLRFVRPAVVINDPQLSASQPPAALAASAGNALGHAIEGPATVRASPVPVMAARRAADLIGGAFPPDAEPDRDALALGALLSGYTIDSAWYGLHHVLSQTLVRFAGAGHGPANTALLPHTARALADRGRDVRPQDVETADRLAVLAGATSLRAIGVDPDDLDACADEAAARAELDLTPARADRAEIRALYAAAT